MESEVTIDVLAQEFELPVSTIRMYQSRRLIPPPTKRGRVGYYADTHRRRLSAIGALQDRGFSLAAIKETLDSWEAGASVGELIGARSIAGTSVEEPLVELTGAELRERFGKEGLTATQLFLVHGCFRRCKYMKKCCVRLHCTFRPERTFHYFLALKYVG